jgi:hypothetical protein
MSSDVGARGWGTDDDDMATQRRKSSNTRDGGVRTLNISFMFVTELVSQLDRSGLNVVGSKTFEPPASPNSSDRSVTPVVHDLASSTSSVGLETNASRPVRSRLVYVTPPRVNEAPTATPGHFTVTPLDAM